MDQPGLEPTVHRQALEALARVNVMSRTTSAMWQGLAAAGLLDGHPLRILDVACGGGDVAIGLVKLGRQRRMPLEIHGCDVSPVAVDYARAAAEAAQLDQVRFWQCDVLHDALPDDYDAVICTLFLHHLAEPEAITLLKKMAAAARRAVLVDDLVRTRLGYLLAWAGGRLLTRSPIVHVDGPRSVRAALTPAEFRAIFDLAKLPGTVFRRHWPERLLASWRRP